MSNSCDDNDYTTATSKNIEKYDNYFKDSEILSTPEMVETTEPKTLLFVDTDLQTKRLASLKKETFEDILKTANI